MVLVPAGNDSAKQLDSSLKLYHKTKLCRFHANGCCTRGENCVFAHTKSELRTPPDFFKTRICKQYSAVGYCADEKCNFAHGKAELRKPNVNMYPSVSSSSTGLDKVAEGYLQPSVGLALPATAARLELAPEGDQQVVRREAVARELMGRPAPIGPASRGLEAQTAFLNPGWLNKVFEVNASEVGFSSATTATALPMYLPRGEVPGVGDAAAADPFWPPMPASPDEAYFLLCT
eukprot:TRINITY_DN16917_c0_g1_i7.p1 TRINITY_DN16917_c0_g1~~TRINITY_DN16917_c0_g1_i7.p1  ORF type:complete len:233 (-),score=38.49 TRINITY_DN16917_c0_g1_i7:21-719(-)